MALPSVSRRSQQSGRTPINSMRRLLTVADTMPQRFSRHTTLDRKRGNAQGPGAPRRTRPSPEVEPPASVQAWTLLAGGALRREGFGAAVHGRASLRLALPTDAGVALRA